MNTSFSHGKSRKVSLAFVIIEFPAFWFRQKQRRGSFFFHSLSASKNHECHLTDNLFLGAGFFDRASQNVNFSCTRVNDRSPVNAIEHSRQQQHRIVLLLCFSYGFFTPQLSFVVWRMSKTESLPFLDKGNEIRLNVWMKSDRKLGTHPCAHPPRGAWCVFVNNHFSWSFLCFHFKSCFHQLRTEKTTKMKCRFFFSKTTRK